MGRWGWACNNPSSKCPGDASPTLTRCGPPPTSEKFNKGGGNVCCPDMKTWCPYDDPDNPGMMCCNKDGGGYECCSSGDELGTFIPPFAWPDDNFGFACYPLGDKNPGGAKLTGDVCGNPGKKCPNPNDDENIECCFEKGSTSGVGVCVKSDSHQYVCGGLAAGDDDGLNSPCYSKKGNPLMACGQSAALLRGDKCGYPNE